MAVESGVNWIVNGDPRRRCNIVITGDGYQDLDRFRQHAQEFADYLFALEPFTTLKCAINLYLLNATSQDLGAAVGAGCEGEVATPGHFTAFGSHLCVQRVSRGLALVTDYIPLLADGIFARLEDPNGLEKGQLPHAILVLVDDKRYGAGQMTITPGDYAYLAPIALTTVFESEPKDLQDWKATAVHELGHALFGFGEEYPFYEGCGIDDKHDIYEGSEPAAPNVTASHGHKWTELMTPNVPLPTLKNSNCTTCNFPDANSGETGCVEVAPASTILGPPPAAIVGAFEGAGGYHCGLYRSQWHCMMRIQGHPFCAACQKRIRQTLGCHAPVFAPITGPFGVFIDLWWGIQDWFGRVLPSRLLPPVTECQRRRSFFRWQHAAEGNDDPCWPI